MFLIKIVSGARQSGKTLHLTRLALRNSYPLITSKPEELLKMEAFLCSEFDQETLYRLPILIYRHGEDEVFLNSLSKVFFSGGIVVDDFDMMAKETQLLLLKKEHKMIAFSRTDHSMGMKGKQLLVVKTEYKKSEEIVKEVENEKFK